MRITQCVLVLFATWMAETASADEIFLQGGSKLEGKARREADTIVVELENGEVRLPADTVERIQRSTPPAEAAQRRRASLGANDIAGRLELAKYCREHELRATERALLLEIVDRAPDHAAARRMLGQVKTAQGWIDRSQQLQTQRDAEEAERLERMRAQDRETRAADEAHARRERDRAVEAESEAQHARERERARDDDAAARARAAVDFAPVYDHWAPRYREPTDHRWQPERPRSWADQAAPRWPIHWMREPTDRRWQPERPRSWAEQAAPRWPIHWMRDPRDPALWR